MEFALTMPLMLALAAAVVDFGWYFNQQMTVLHAVREGARAGSITAEDGDPATVAIARVQEALDAANIDYSQGTIDALYSGSPPMELIEVSASLPYQPIVTLVPVPVNLNAALTMRLEDQADE